MRKIIKQFVLLLSVATLVMSTGAYAKDETLFYASNDITFYSQGGVCPTIVGSSAVSTGSVAPYKNPVVNYTAPDPSVIYGEDGKFHIYATGFQHLVSNDMVNWKKVDTDGWINIKNHPSWSDQWAPDISKIDDTYILSFSGKAGGVRKIGYATSSSANGPFAYQGELLHQSDRGKVGSGYDIDSNIIQTEEGSFLYYGSGTGSISMAKLTKDGDKLSASPSKIVMTTKIGKGPVVAEGAFVYKEGEYYYMLFSSGDWRNTTGGSSGYRLHAARSKTPDGNFTEKNTPIVESNDAFRSPGHGSVISDSTGQDWSVYMAYPKGSANRTVVLDKISYVDDWPSINNGKGVSSEKQQGSSSGATSIASSDSSDTSDTNITCTCKATVSSISGSNNEEKAFNFFVGKGYSPQQTAGIVGNMKAESGVLPMRKQSTPQETLTSSKDAEDISSGWGLVQWTPAGKMIKPSKEAGKSYEEIDTLDYQLQFLHEQLSGEGIGAIISEKAAGDDLKTQTTIDGAARSFMLKYERPKDQSESKQVGRVQLANEVFGLYGNSSSTVAVSSSSTGSSGCGSSSSGGSVVSIAQAELAKGVKESPLGCDHGNSSSKGDCGAEVNKYTDSHLEYWCADFVSWVYKEAGTPFTGGSSGGWRIPSVSGVQAWFEKNGNWVANGPGVIPKPGDVYTMGISHTGIVEKVEGDTVYTISGNTATDDTRNGNGVGRGEYAVGSSSIKGYGSLK